MPHPTPPPDLHPQLGIHLHLSIPPQRPWFWAPTFRKGLLQTDPLLFFKCGTPHCHVENHAVGGGVPTETLHASVNAASSPPLLSGSWNFEPFPQAQLGSCFPLIQFLQCRRVKQKPGEAE